jgi:hypothetical protein
MTTILEVYQIKSFPVISLIVLNFTSLLLALIFGWRTFDLILIFWTENLAIGIFNLLKMMVVMRKGSDKNGCFGIFLIPFFIVHFFGFCFGHGIFIAVLLSPEKLESIGVLGPLHGLV